jgi:hypothetical protein
MNIQGIPVEIQTPTQWNVTGHSTIVPMPVLFFRHLRLITLSLPQERI